MPIAVINRDPLPKLVVVHFTVCYALATKERRDE